MKQKGCRNRCQINQQIIKNQVCVFVDFREAIFPKPGWFWDPFWEPFSAKSWNNASKKRCENRCRKSIVKWCQTEQKVMPKGIQIEPEISFISKMWFCENHAFAIVKAWFWRFQVCKINGKSIQKRCENRLRKNDAQIIKHDAKMEAKLEQKPVKI